ncbi:hypothetical protein [Actinospica robiniae]|uniref:hypothetical protein n=1 Tax=Actinospica robiniae TaxID=304901 RepID=UPI00040D8A45|nr:hypothetical protein [Actinospica robiniae]
MSVALIPPTAPTVEQEPGRLRAFVAGQRPSLVVGSVVGALLIMIAIRLPLGDDLTLHVAVLRRIIADPLHPGNPVIDTGGSSIYYSPYMLALALPGKLFGLSAITLYKVAAIINVLLLLTGMYRFVRTLTPAGWAPPLAWIGLATWWGTSAIGWSGFLSLLSLAGTEAYPSTLATALALHLWASLNDREARTLSSPLRMAGLGAWYGVILLIHQFTAMNAAIGCAAILISRHRELRTKATARALGAALAACVAVVVIWPYYHLWSISQGELDVLDPVHRPLYAHMATWYAMGVIVGAVALALRWRRAKTDVLVLLFLFAGAVVAYGWLTGHWSYGRSWPTTMLAAQLAVAVTVAESRARLLRLWVAVVAVMTTVGLMTQAGALVYVLPSAWQPSATSLLRHTPVPTRAYVDNRPRLSWLDRYLRPNDVVAADVRVAQYEVAAHGAYDVTTPWYLPEISTSQWAARNAATRAIFAPTTPAAERDSLLRKYDVGWLLLTTSEAPPAGADIRLTAEGDGFQLYRVLS